MRQLSGSLMLLFLLVPCHMAAAKQVVQPAMENPYLAPQKRLVLTEKEAFVLGDTEKVAGSFVSAVLPSPEGRYALIVRRAINLTSVPTARTPDEINLLVWDSRTRRTRSLWNFSGAASDTTRNMSWFRGTSALLMDLPAIIETPGQPAVRSRAMYVVDLARATVRMIGTPSEILRYNVSSTASPTTPIIALNELAKDADDRIVSAGVRIVKSSGESKLITVPQGSTLLRDQPWSPDGRLIYLQSYTKPDTRYFAFDSSSGIVEPLTGKPTAQSASTVLTSSTGIVLMTRQSESVLKAAETDLKLHPLWLEGDTKGPAPRALVEADLDGEELVSLMPDNTAVLFRKNGALFALPLQRFERNGFLKGRRKALQEVTLRQAERIFGALISYTADHDGKLPAEETSHRDGIGRYTTASLNDPTTGKLNTLVFPNPNVNLRSLHEVPDQAKTTVLGQLQSSVGKAVIWADGHVTWEDSP